MMDLTEAEIKDLMQKFAALKEQCEQSIQKLKEQLKCPSNYNNNQA